MRTSVTQQSRVLVTGSVWLLADASVILDMLGIDASTAVTQRVTVTAMDGVA